MAKKSNAQLKRLQKRAAERGETYEAQEKAAEQSASATGSVEKHSTVKDDEKRTTKLFYAARQLKKELELIECNEQLKAKDRRSQKRKAEAIASESTGMHASELLEWLAEHQATASNSTTAKGKAVKSQNESRKNPYIVFIGQLSYETTKDEILAHFQKELKDEHIVTHENMKVRLLTDPRTKKSRGMAFLEVTDPELLYACLKLHHTTLNGRRLNVERSAGGGKHSETRKSKLKQYREEQEQHMESIVNTMLDEFKKSGDIQENELDEGVISLCKRHSAKIVQAALERYIETTGRDMDNPSAYLTFLISKMAEEGIFEDKSAARKGYAKEERPQKRQRISNVKNDRMKESSVFARKGVAMVGGDASEGNLSKIFPSMARGRGRGRPQI